MGPLNWKRLALLVVLGIATGYVAARLVDISNAHPLAAPGALIVTGAIVAILLRRLELMNFLIEDGLFLYAGYIGMAFVRASGFHNYLAAQPGNWHLAGWVQEVNILVAVAGIPFVLISLFVVALPVWAFAQRSIKQGSDERFWSFVENHLR